MTCRRRGATRERSAYYEELLLDAGELGTGIHTSLASPGATLGVGSLVFVAAQCGRCSRGGVYLPIIPGYVRLHAVSPGFLQASGVRLVDGRGFTLHDRLGSPKVMVVNQAFAESHFQQGRPIGRKVQIGGPQDPWYTVVGIVDSTGVAGLGSSSSTQPVVYVPILQDPPHSADLTVQTAYDAVQLIPDLNDLVSNAGVTRRGTIVSATEESTAHHTAPIRWLGIVFAIAGGLTLIVALHGIYSVMRYKVSRLKKEIGIRRAHGARRYRVVSLIVGRSLWLTCIGVTLGCWGALLVAGWLQTVFAAVRAFDLQVYTATSLLLSIAALAGGSLAAWRATILDPADAIRRSGY